MGKNGIIRQEINEMITYLNLIKQSIVSVAGKFFDNCPQDFSVEKTADSKFGDLVTNISFMLQSPEVSPRKVAEMLVPELLKDSQLNFVERIEVAGPGYINFFLSKDFLRDNIGKIINLGKDYGRSDLFRSQKVLLEHTSPDPIKTLHIGHLRNNFLGMAMRNLWEFCGAEVVTDCVNNDRGTHVARVMWGYLIFAKKNVLSDLDKIRNFKVDDEGIYQISQDSDWRQSLSEWKVNSQNWLLPKDLNLKSDHFNLRFYALGSKAEKLNAGFVGRQVREILQDWESCRPEIRDLWHQIINWSLEGYSQTYERIHSRHDFVWSESDYYQEGKDIILSGLKLGIFRKMPEGVILSDLGDFGLPDTVLLKSDETALYHTQDLALTKLKTKKFSADLYVWVVGNDQLLYFKQLFAFCDQLGIGEGSLFEHLNFGYITLKDLGKMSSREGTIVSADDLLDRLVEEVSKFRDGEHEEQPERSIDEIVALGALKFSFLKHNRQDDIQFSLREAINLKGNSGPYLQYTCVRARNILKKSTDLKSLDKGVVEKLLPEEISLMRDLCWFPFIIEKSLLERAPNILCNYLFDLAQTFNVFYQNVSVIKESNDQVRSWRLGLVFSCKQVLENGLGILGIEVPEKM